MRCFHSALTVKELFREHRLYGESLKSGSCGGDAGKTVIEPIRDRRIHRVVMGIHLLVFLKLEPLPHGGGAVSYHEADRRIFSPRHQLPRDIGSAGIGKDIEYIARAEVPGRQTHSGIGYSADKQVKGLSLPVLREYSEPQRKGLARLRAGRQPAGFRVVPPFKECAFNVFRLFKPHFPVVLFSEDRGEERKGDKVIIPVSGRHIQSGGY